MNPKIFIFFSFLLLTACLPHALPSLPQESGIHTQVDAQLGGNRQSSLSLGTQQQLKDADVAINQATLALKEAQTAIANQHTEQAEIIHNYEPTQRPWWYYVITEFFDILRIALISLLTPSWITMLQVFKKNKRGQH